MRRSHDFGADGSSKHPMRGYVKSIRDYWMLNEYFRNSGDLNEMFENISSQMPEVRTSGRHCKQSNCSATHAKWYKDCRWMIFGRFPLFSSQSAYQTISAKKSRNTSIIKDSVAGIRMTVASSRWRGRKPRL